MRKLWLMTVLLVVAGAVRADNPKYPQMMVKPDQVAQVENPPYVAAGDKCENWAWAATVEAMLAQQDVKFDKQFWLFKVYGGSLCVDMGDWQTIADRMNGDYRTDDGRQFHIEITFTPGTPTLMDDIIASLKKGRVVALVWKGHPYLLQGVLYDEHVATSGTRYLTAKELHLLDPFVASGEGHAVTFKTTDNDPSEIQGTYQVTATEILGTDWLRQRTK